MQRKALTMGLMGGLAVLSMAAVPAAADAHRYHGGGYYGGGYGGYGYDRGYHGGRGYYGDRGYYGRGSYGGGYYGRHHRCNGTGGAIVGAVAGGLLGNAVAGRGDRTAGTLIGGGLGALAGNAIGRDC